MCISVRNKGIHSFIHSSPLICSVAKLAMTYPWSSSGQNYCAIVYECSADLQGNDSHIVASYIRAIDGGIM